MDSTTRDLVVISDLHLGRGKNPNTGRYYHLEAFFYDDDFLRFCRHLCAQASGREPFKLILNGDTFDFLRIERDETPGAGEGRYGPVLTPPVAAALQKQILDGHPDFVRGLAEILMAGHDVIFLPGNHDIELQWDSVQDVVREALAAALSQLEQESHDGDGECDGDNSGDGDSAASRAAARLRFEPWFYYEPGRIWIEHGCQYDPENSFRYPLRRGLDTAADAVHGSENDLPLGNFFQRYLYNEFGHITFIVPSTRANLRYLRWFIFNQPALLIRVLLSHLPFLFQILRRLAKSIKATGPRHVLADNHQRELDELAETSGLGDKLREVDEFKDKRADVVQATREFLLQTLKLAAVFVVVTGMSAALWSLGFMSISGLRSGIGFKALLFLGLNLVALFVTFGLILFSLRRFATGPPNRPLRRAAAKIAKLLDVELVTFGHTHEEVIYPVLPPIDQRRGWYFNTGTWISVFTHDVFLPRDRVQYTFLKVSGQLRRAPAMEPGSRGVVGRDPHRRGEPVGRAAVGGAGSLRLRGWGEDVWAVESLV